MKRLLFILCVLVLAACGGDDATDTADDTSPATTPTTVAAPTTTVAAIEETTTTTEVAETTTTTEVAVMSDAEAATLAAYETTWNGGNEDAFRALFASQDVLLEEPEHLTTRSGDVDFIVGQGIGRRAMEIVLSIDDCARSDDTVVCTAEFDGPVPTAINFSPWRDKYVFSFEDGQITHIKVTCVICINFDFEERLIAWARDQTDWGTKFGVILVNTEEEGAEWLEWASKWQEAGRP